MLQTQTETILSAALNVPIRLLVSYLSRYVESGGSGGGLSAMHVPQMSHHSFAPEAAPVLQPPHAAAVLVAHHALGADGQVALQPLVGHEDLGGDTHAEDTRVRTRWAVKRWLRLREERSPRPRPR